MNPQRRTWTRAALGAAAVAHLPGLGAQARWRPTRPVDYIVPSGPGAALDLAARTLKDIIERQ